MSKIRDIIENERITTPTKVGDAVNADEAVSKGQITGTTPLSGLNADLLRGLPADFTSSKTANGYQKLPSGLIIQWGTTLVNGGSSTTVTLPIAFPNTAVSVTASANTVADGSTSVTIVDNTSIKVGFWNDATSNIEFYWLAIGY